MTTESRGDPQSTCRIAVVIGTRAQLIKMAPVMRRLEDAAVDYRFIYTSQHRDTLDDLRVEFGIKSPDYVLFDWSDEARTLGRFGGWLLFALGKLLLLRRAILPFSGGIVLTHGDTASTVWGALLGRLTGNQVMHVESGLRSFNLLQPFPEELNRLLTLRLSHIYACPGQWAVDNLRRHRGEKINTGANTMYDSVNMALVAADASHNTPLAAKPYAVASIHRFENVFRRTRFNTIVKMVADVARSIPIVFVLHPVTAKQLDRFGLRQELAAHPGVELCPRLGFFAFQKLLSRSEFVITDGGSNQEELFYLGKPTLILRKVSERTEGLNRNAVLADLDRQKVTSFVAEYKNYQTPPFRTDEGPSGIIVDWLAKHGYASKD